MVCRGTVRDGVIVPESDLSLPDGAEVRIQYSPESTIGAGNGTSIGPGIIQRELDALISASKERDLSIDEQAYADDLLDLLDELTIRQLQRL